MARIGGIVKTAFLLAAFAATGTMGALRAEGAEIHVPRDFSSIQAAVDAAVPGDTVVVAGGAYRESVVVAKQVALKSEPGRDATSLIAAREGENALSIIGVSGEPGASVAGFTISAPGASAVLIRDSSKVSVTDNKLTQSVNGLLAERSRGVRLYGNAAVKNEKGVYFYYVDSSLIEKNNADSNVNNGILLHASHRNRIVGNTTDDNFWNGITLSASNDNEIRENRSIKNTYAIVISESTGNVLSGNVERRRLFWLLPVALVYAAIMLYLVERKAFQLYYRIKYNERA